MLRRVVASVSRYLLFERRENLPGLLLVLLGILLLRFYQFYQFKVGLQ